MPFCNHCGADVSGCKFCQDCGRPCSADTEAREDVDFEEYDQKGKGGVGGDPTRNEVLFSGTTWPLWCLSPVICSVTYWIINRKRIDWEHGCCRNHADTIDLRRIRDIALRTNPFQRIVGRGTILIFSDATLTSQCHVISKFGARKLYQDLRTAWTESKMGMTDENAKVG